MTFTGRCLCGQLYEVQGDVMATVVCHRDHRQRQRAAPSRSTW
ncbi:MAG: hypothetical protein R2710_16440 [Acidimicrobiales bacterium]